jgi:hypothetical protein
MKTKICTKCKKEKNINEFGKHRLHLDGLQSQCKICKRQIDKIYNDLHKKEILKRVKEWYQLHKEHRSKYMESYNESHKEELKIKQKQRYQVYKEEILDRNHIYIRNRCKTDINFRLRRNLAKRIWDALKGNVKSVSTMKLVGCTIEQLKQHLEKQFKSGMNWNNYGKWHVDHIKPCYTFDLSKPNEQYKCFHYTNLRPLWAIDNLTRPKI